MDLALDWQWIVGALALFVALSLWGRRREGQRAAELEEFALRHGMTFQSADPNLLETGLADLPLFRIGYGRRCRNVVRGNRGGLELALFEYSYRLRSGRQTSTHGQTVCAVELRGRGLPRFELSPTSALGRLGALFRSGDLRFESAPEFSRVYRLRGEGEEAIRAVFRPDVVSHFAVHPGRRVQGGGDWIALYRRSRRLPPDELDRFLEEAARIARLLA